MEDKALPAGISAIHTACKELYPEQTDPVQVAAVLKYWLGGPDPLDYISIYRNTGSPSPHWHYVSYGLSNLYGDKRSYTEIEGLSGFGFELTFRLCCDEEAPPSWPAELLQSIARYVTSSESVLCVGDHISWHSALDGGEGRLEHLLLCEDPQLHPLTTDHGQLTFIQCVGVDKEELQSAQWWNCLGVLSLMAQHTVTGGPLLVTDMRRGESLFTVDPPAKGVVDAGVSSQGSLLSGVNALVSWNAPPMTSDPQLPRPMEEVKVQLSREALLLIPVVIRGRLKHGRHFTFKSMTGDVCAVTLVVGGVEGALCSEASPIVAHGLWLQVFLTSRELESLENGVRGLLEARVDEFEMSEVHVQWTILQEP